MTVTSELDAAMSDVLDHIDEPAEVRPKPFVTALPVGALFADPTYQRELDDLRVQRMIDEFDQALVGVLEVSDRGDNRYAILDGQHRWAACSEVDSSMHVVCQVHRGLTVADEARVFYEVDVRRRALSGWDRWKARRGAGDAVVLAIEQIVEDAGLKVDPASKDGNISATGAIEKVYTVAGPSTLVSTLNILREGFGAVRDAFDGSMIQAVAMILTTYGTDELDVQRLVEQLQTIPPRQVKSKAQALKEAHRAEMPRLYAAVIIDRYNAGRGRKVEEFLSIAPSQSKALSKDGRRSRQLDAIRRWANRNGYSVSSKARVARDVLDAYKQAHPDFELAAN